MIFRIEKSREVKNVRSGKNETIKRLLSTFDEARNQAIGQKARMESRANDKRNSQRLS
jgi:hypothetical protein